MSDLFDSVEPLNPSREAMAEGAVLMRGKALPFEADILIALQVITAQAPFRHMTTPGGYVMSVAMTNCGAAGWVTDRTGYRYDPIDPESGHPWPALPDGVLRRAIAAATDAGYPQFLPDACLINRYEPGARLSLHQDRNERDLRAPIVSVSLGLPAVFLLGGPRRAQRPQRVPVAHGDVVVWGGPARLFYHGVMALKDGEHASLGRCRVNLTFRRAL